MRTLEQSIGSVRNLLGGRKFGIDDVVWLHRRLSDNLSAEKEFNVNPDNYRIGYLTEQIEDCRRIIENKYPDFFANKEEF